MMLSLCTKPRSFLPLLFAWFMSSPFSSFALNSLSAPMDNPLRTDGNLDFIRPDGSVAASIAIEIADTPRMRSIGLMFRRLFGDTHGMLFIFQTTEPQEFWMRNTPSSLDIIFIGESHRVINIAQGTTPLSDQIYRSVGPARYVLEVSSGFSDRHGIGPGTLIQWYRPDVKRPP